MWNLRSFFAVTGEKLNDQWLPMLYGVNCRCRNRPSRTREMVNYGSEDAYKRFFYG